jgi:hypothetical protein
MLTGGNRLCRWEIENSLVESSESGLSPIVQAPDHGYTMGISSQSIEGGSKCLTF